MTAGKARAPFALLAKVKRLETQAQAQATAIDMLRAENDRLRRAQALGAVLAARLEIDPGSAE